MKKRLFMVATIFLIAVISFNYVDIVTTVLSHTDYSDEAIEAIKINVEPEDRLGEMAAASLDSIFISKIDKEAFYKKLKYIAIDAEAFHELSKADKQYLTSYFKKYNDKVIYASRADLKKLLLYNPVNKSFNGGMLITVSKVLELSKDKAVLQVFDYINKSDGAGYKCTLTFMGNKWEVQSIEMNYIP